MSAKRDFGLFAVGVGVNDLVLGYLLALWGLASLGACVALVGLYLLWPLLPPGRLKKITRKSGGQP